MYKATPNIEACGKTGDYYYDESFYNTQHSMNRLPTATRVDAHCRVILEDHITSIIHIQERHWGQMIWNTAWGGYFRLSANSVDKRLDGGVVC
jgi:hypothetical protein